MNTVKRNTMRGALLSMALCAPVSAMAGGDQGVAYIGGSKGHDTWYTYAGAVHALGGKISESGLLGRIALGLGGYQYNTVAVVGGKVDGDVQSAQLGLGYQFVTNSSTSAAYISGHYEKNETSPNDASNVTNGDETGGALQLEHTQKLGMFRAGLMGSLSTVNDSHWARGRLGFEVGGNEFGGEYVDMGSDSYDAHRVGVYVNIPMNRNTISLSGGHHHSSGRTATSATSHGGYVELSLSHLY